MSARSPRALLILPLLLALPCLAEPAGACHVGSWNHGPTHRLEAVNESGVRAGVYARERTGWHEAPGSFGCEDMSWRDLCTMPVGPVGGVVPESETVAPDRPECLVGPLDFGVYVNGTEVGTEQLP